jgi:hypothetical protein
MLSFFAWLILLVICWPLALLALVAWPIGWLISIPLRLIGSGIGAVLALVKAVVYLPARVLGYRG